MSKVITFSRHFPKGHPKEGQETFFVEQIYNSIGVNIGITKESGDISEPMWSLVNDFFLLDGSAKKHHTIRAGNRWKVGDRFSPRVWGNDINIKSGRSGPYQSKQIVIAPDIEIKKVWDFKIGIFPHLWAEVDNERDLNILIAAKNDGLSPEDFCHWFFHNKKKEVFTGQIICWNENINY